MKNYVAYCIAGALAAEQRPAGATENHVSTTPFFRPVRGLNRFATRSHGCHRGLLSHATPWLKKRRLIS